jgi:thioredoxin-like negative regulator of GroEL
MIEVSKQEAIERVNSEPLVFIMWSISNCPVCEQLDAVIKELEEDGSEWNFYKVTIESRLKELGRTTSYFEPDLLPNNFMFKNGKRILVATGAIPKKDIAKILHDINTEGYKTNEELVQEELDALD